MFRMSSCFLALWLTIVRSSTDKDEKFMITRLVLPKPSEIDPFDIILAHFSFSVLVGRSITPPDRPVSSAHKQIVVYIFTSIMAADGGQ